MNLQTSPSLPIGMFDSGIGGLTVMRQITQSMPREQIIYLGDTARVPYGDKSRETIIRYSLENASFLIKKNIKLLIIACNTASAFALNHLQQVLNVPVIGVIEPGVEAAIAATRNQRIAVLGTKGTIQSGAYQSALQQRLPYATIFPIACPLFVPLVEEQFLHHPATQLIVKEYLQPLHKENVDTLLLGCTHYPFLKSLIQEEMGAHVTLIDSASSCARQVTLLLQDHQLQSPLLCPQHQYYVSDDTEKFQKIMKELFHLSAEQVEKIQIETESGVNRLWAFNY